MKGRLADWGNTILICLLFPLVILASFLVQWIFSDMKEDHDD